MMKIQRCSSTEPYHQALVPSRSQHNTFYVVTVPFFESARDEWACTCQGFMFRGYCQHLDMVHVCGWVEGDLQPQSDAQKEKRICPRCGQGTVEEWE